MEAKGDGTGPGRKLKVAALERGGGGVRADASGL